MQVTWIPVFSDAAGRTPSSVPWMRRAAHRPGPCGGTVCPACGHVTVLPDGTASTCRLCGWSSSASG